MRALARGCTASRWQSRDLGCKATLPSAGCLGDTGDKSPWNKPGSLQGPTAGPWEQTGRRMCVYWGAGMWEEPAASPIWWLCPATLPTPGRRGSVEKVGGEGAGLLWAGVWLWGVLVGFVSAPLWGAGLSGQGLRVHCPGDFSCDPSPLYNRGSERDSNLLQATQLARSGGGRVLSRPVPRTPRVGLWTGTTALRAGAPGRGRWWCL